MLFLALACLSLGSRSVARAAQEDAPPPRYELRVAEDSALELHAAWEPCAKSRFGIFDSTPALSAPAPARERERYGSDAFRALLPGHPVTLGEVWKVDDGAVLVFLRQFHPGAAWKSLAKGEVPGTFACLRAVSEDAFEIFLRAHAVFELENDVVYKPAQFEGRLLLERESGALRAFQLELPSRHPNADALRRSTRTQPPRADIGWVPRMELSSGAQPVLQWSHEVPDEEVRLALRRSFYSFAALDWLPLEQAAQRSRETQKPLHLMVLLGALDDDSC